MRKFITVLAASLLSLAAFAQGQLVTWSSHVESGEGNKTTIVFTGKIAEGYHTYTLTDEFSATTFMDLEINGGELAGDPYELSTPKEEKDEFGDIAKHYYDEIILAQNVNLTSSEATFKGTIFTNSCTGGACKAEYYDFDVKVSGATAVKAAQNHDEVTAPEQKKRSGSIWGLILEAMELMGAADKNEVLMVGDRLYDIEGAKGAGVKSCGVLWGYGSEEEFRQYEADFIVKEAKDVLGLVKASK